MKMNQCVQFHGLYIMKMNHCVQFHGLYIMEITRLDRFLWFVYNENEPMRAISWLYIISGTTFMFH